MEARGGWESLRLCIWRKGMAQELILGLWKQNNNKKYYWRKIGDAGVNFPLSGLSYWETAN